MVSPARTPSRCSIDCWPSPPPCLPVLGPPSSPVDRNYEIGTKDPPVGHDPGAGVWNSKPTEASYFALKQAIGGYSTLGKGTATVSGTKTDPTYTVDFECKFYDRYNWDAGKSVTFAGITVTDRFMGEFHRQGLAQEYDCNGSFKRRLTWKKGDAIPPGQLEAPGGR